MDDYRAKLAVIRGRLLRLRLERALKLYVRKWRAAKAGVRPDVLNIGGNAIAQVVRIQHFARKYVIGKNILRR